LLLIFFMVSSTFREHLGIDITLPQAESAEEQRLDIHEVTVTAKGDLYFGEQRVDEIGLKESIAALLTAEPEAVLVLRADEGADFGRVLRAIDITRSAGGARMIIPTRYRDVAQPEPGASSP
ncbi:MAG TPA: biopolymer transporter ExbD, partial [Candidatus Hydrogenedentes bacterium]|nr:biopolymer transporter ExbD [Candidatus Hydrogenedentota bacterium]